VDVLGPADAGVHETSPVEPVPELDREGLAGRGGVHRRRAAMKRERIDRKARERARRRGEADARRRERQAKKQQQNREAEEVARYLTGGEK
jgi:hypothetical protein